jgi:hypothetical protein
LEYFQLGGCCIPYQPEPTIRLGVPPGPQDFDVRTIDGIVVYIPHSLPDVPLEIRLSTFFGFKRLVVAGWRHC